MSKMFPQFESLTSFPTTLARLKPLGPLILHIPVVPLSEGEGLSLLSVGTYDDGVCPPVRSAQT